MPQPQEYSISSFLPQDCSPGETGSQTLYTQCRPVGPQLVLRTSYLPAPRTARTPKLKVELSCSCLL